MKKILGIDFGVKRCGIAETDSNQIIATGITTIPPEEVYNFIESYLKENKLELIVVGLPKNLDCSNTDATELAQNFANSIQKKFKNIKVELIDERLTSKIARQTLIQAGVKKKKRRNKKLLDKISATLILQSYLNFKK